MQKKGTLKDQSACARTAGLLGAEDRILGGFGDAELNHALGRDLDLFAGRGIAADARGTIHQHEFSQAGQGELVLGVFVGQLSDALENLAGLLFGESILFSDCGGHL